jgi:outer membrane protein
LQKNPVMKIGLIVVNAILLVAVAILFYLHFDSPKKDSTDGTVSKSAGSPTVNDSSSSVRIGYFVMDEIEENFQMIKDFKDSMIMKENNLNNELDKMEKEYQKQYNEYLLKDGGTISQAHQQALIDLSDKMKDREKLLKLEKDDFSRTEQMKMKSLLENVIQELNKDNRYTYIMSYEPGFIYYKDPRYDITSEVLNGLNKKYKKKKS